MCVHRGVFIICCDVKLGGELVMKSNASIIFFILLQLFRWYHAPPDQAAPALSDDQAAPESFDNDQAAPMHSDDDQAAPTSSEDDQAAPAPSDGDQSSDEEPDPVLEWGVPNHEAPDIPQFRTCLGVLVDTTEMNLPIDFFKYFVDDDLCDLVVHQTNAYAEEFMRNNPNLRPHSPLVCGLEILWIDLKWTSSLV